MFSKSLWTVTLAALHYPIATLATPSPNLEARQNGCFSPVPSYPNGPTANVCYDTTYYRASDQGQMTSSDTNVFLSQCQASCVSDSRCTAFVLAMQLAVDTNLATGVCFFYDHTPAPRFCSDNSSRRIFAQFKTFGGACNGATSPSTTISTTSSITTSSATTPSTTTSSSTISSSTTSSSTASSSTTSSTISSSGTAITTSTSSSGTSSSTTGSSTTGSSTTGSSTTGSSTTGSSTTGSSTTGSSTTGSSTTGSSTTSSSATTSSSTTSATTTASSNSAAASTNSAAASTNSAAASTNSAAASTNSAAASTNSAAASTNSAAASTNSAAASTNSAAASTNSAAATTGSAAVTTNPAGATSIPAAASSSAAVSSGAPAVATAPPVACDPSQVSNVFGSGGCSDNCVCDPDVSGTTAYCYLNFVLTQSCTSDADCPTNQYCDSYYGADNAFCSSSDGCTSTYTGVAKRNTLFGTMGEQEVGAARNMARKLPMRIARKMKPHWAH